MYVSKNHRKYDLTVHLIFVVKYRHKLLNVLGDHTKNLVKKACKKHNYELILTEVDKDHIHILLSYDPIESITSIVKNLKQYTTYYLRKTHNDYINKFIYGSRRVWSKGYFACSIGKGASYEVIKEYIKNQG